MRDTYRLLQRGAAVRGAAAAAEADWSGASRQQRGASVEISICHVMMAAAAASGFSAGGDGSGRKYPRGCSRAPEAGPTRVGSPGPAAELEAPQGAFVDVAADARARRHAHSSQVLVHRSCR